MLNYRSFLCDKFAPYQRIKCEMRQKIFFEFEEITETISAMEKQRIQTEFKEETVSRKRKQAIYLYNLPVFGYILREQNHLIRCPYCGKERRMKPGALSEIKSYTCPNCENNSTKSIGEISAWVERNGHKIIVKCKAGYDSFLNALESFENHAVDITLSSEDIAEMFISLTFNLQKGHIYLSYLGKKQRVLFQHDVTEEPFEIYNFLPIMRVVENNKTIARRIKREFESVWKSKLPFEVGLHSYDKLRLMTMFVGYDETFYYALPFEENGYLIERSFRKRKKGIHFSRNLPKLLRNSSLPDSKSIRRMMFTRPWLFFYLKELCDVYELFDSIIVLKQLLSCDDSKANPAKYMLFPLIFHKFPKITRMHRLLFEHFPEKPFLSVQGDADFYLSHTNSFINYLLGLSLLNDKDLHLEMKRIQKKKRIKYTTEMKRHFHYGILFLYKRIGAWISIPCSTDGLNIGDTVIGNYRFFRLKNTSDYLLAGQRLKNCLGSWWEKADYDNREEDVYVASERGSYIAAFSVIAKGEKTVVEYASGLRNRSIRRNKALMNAYEKWKSKFDLTDEKENWP